MTDPKRWTESDSDSTEIERELVTAGQRANLPPELKQEMWSALVHSALPLAPPIQASTEGGSSATAASSLSHQLSTAKLVLGLAALGAASSGGYWVLNRSSRATVTLPSAPPARTDASAAGSAWVGRLHRRRHFRMVPVRRRRRAGGGPQHFPGRQYRRLQSEHVAPALRG